MMIHAKTANIFKENYLLQLGFIVMISRLGNLNTLLLFKTQTGKEILKKFTKNYIVSEGLASLVLVQKCNKILTCPIMLKA